jgi:hypothetical protein
MPINELVGTNPELIKANLIVGNALEKLLANKWGSVTMRFTLQDGRITMLRVEHEKTHHLLKDELIDNT